MYTVLSRRFCVVQMCFEMSRGRNRVIDAMHVNIYCRVITASMYTPSTTWQDAIASILRLITKQQVPASTLSDTSCSLRMESDVHNVSSLSPHAMLPFTLCSRWSAGEEFSDLWENWRRLHQRMQQRNGVWFLEGAVCKRHLSR